jgi:hypothetical protein
MNDDLRGFENNRSYCNGGTAEKLGKLQFRGPVSSRRFELGSSRIQAYSVATRLNNYNWFQYKG